ncbi:MAG: hypothetical protein H7066_02550 [Cytophagaceae bacterium]|nr:hypothetical protein [Gemmatimonadaceae bacterium]
MGLAATFANGRPWLSPRVEGRLALGGRMDLTGSVSRRHQFVQSMRNAESVVGFVFPADLALGPVPGIIPVAHADEVSLAAELRVAPGVRARASTYAREMRGVVLVAASESAPFAREVPASGSASAMGLSLEGEVSAARYLAMVRYGLQHVRYHHALGSYVPGWGQRSQLEGGITTFPTPTTVVRLGFHALFGRRVTPATGAIEWESCNLKDRGCEFAGTPRTDPALVGTTRAPAYVRIDLSVRKHAHLRLGSREAEVAFFGTYSNLFQRFNVLTYGGRDGLRAPLEMRPPSPLVIGLDWRF